jgi:hypothetical protein
MDRRDRGGNFHLRTGTSATRCFEGSSTRFASACRWTRPFTWGRKLPMLLRGLLYYEGRDPEALPVIIRDGQAFLLDFAWDARLPDSVNTAASVRVPTTCSLAT